MDMFMDKLAQKLTAQEIIKANTTAEAEELNRLRNQIDEYDKCLAKLQQLLEDGAGNLQSSSGFGGSEELGRLVEEKMEKLNSCLQTSAAQSEQLQQLLTERFEEADRKMGERLGNVNRIMGERLESVDKALDERLEDMDAALDRRLENMNSSFEQRFAGLDRSLDEKMSQLDSKLGENGEEQPGDKYLPITEAVHKECVKVYRNVQAVVLEESSKQAEPLGNVAAGVQSVGKKINKVFGVSLIALLLSLLSAIIQIMNMLNIHLF